MSNIDRRSFMSLGAAFAVFSTMPFNAAAAPAGTPMVAPAPKMHLDIGTPGNWRRIGKVYHLSWERPMAERFDLPKTPWRTVEPASDDFDIKAVLPVASLESTLGDLSLFDLLPNDLCLGVVFEGERFACLVRSIGYRIQLYGKNAEKDEVDALFIDASIIGPARVEQIA